MTTSGFQTTTQTELGGHMLNQRRRMNELTAGNYLFTLHTPRSAAFGYADGASYLESAKQQTSYKTLNVGQIAGVAGAVASAVFFPVVAPVGLVVAGAAYLVKRKFVSNDEKVANKIDEFREIGRAMAKILDEAVEEYQKDPGRNIGQLKEVIDVFEESFSPKNSFREDRFKQGLGVTEIPGAKAAEEDQLRTIINGPYQKACGVLAGPIVEKTNTAVQPEGIELGQSRAHDFGPEIGGR